MWTKEWPDKPGLFWFYGWLWYNHKYDADTQPEPELVRVVPASNGLVYIARGNFIWKNENHIGLFTKVVLPQLPNKEILNGYV